MSSLEPGRKLLHYRIITSIGQGGMGEVYKAEDTKLGRQVALKLLPPSNSENSVLRRRFLQEAQAASALNHPHIVTIYSIEDTEGLDFIIMEYVEGESLKERIENEGALPLNSLLDIGIQISDALAAAHSLNLLHRDIKSGNILVNPRGQAKVLDFGLAKLLPPPADHYDFEAPTIANLTDSGTVIGTVAYMSPEQTRGETLDPRSEIFSLGCVLYEAATRTLPFKGPSLLAIMHAIATLEPTPASRLRPDLPREFDLVIERALAKEKERRYQSAAELGEALRSLRANITGAWPGFAIVYDQDLTESKAPIFVGRQAELNKLASYLKEAIGGNGRLVFISGEPGIGKTTLADEFLRRSRKQYPGLIMSRGRCAEQYGPGEAYLPFLEAVGGLLGPGRERVAAVMRTHAPTWCMELPTAFASTGSLERLQQETIGATKDRMMREMGDALGAISAHAPLVLLLEDLHWADPSSVDLLGHLGQRINSQHLLIAGTFRPEDIERSNHPLKKSKAELQAHKQCEEFGLDSLTREHIADCLDASFTPNDFPEELSSLIYEKTEGHPLFATNLLQYLSERGDIAKSAGKWSLVRPLSIMDLEAPESVRSMINKKIDFLAEEDRKALEYASVEGAEFLSTVTASLLGSDEIELEERLARLEKTHRLIETKGEEELPDGSLATRYRFAHALYQNFLYGSLVNKRRITLHKHAGDQLAQHYGNRAPQIATQLAMHYERGRDFPRAVQYLIQAGDNARKLFAFAEAEGHYSHALNLLAKTPSADNAQTVLTLYEKRGTANHTLSRFPQAIKDFTEMLEMARKLNLLDQQAMALNALSTTLFFSHRMEEMAQRTTQALEVADQAGSENLRLGTMCLMGLKHLCYGELDQAKPILDNAIETARKLDFKPALLTSLTWRGCLHFFQTEYERALELEIEAHRLALEIRDGFLLLTSLFFRGLSEGNLGRMSAALKTLNEAIDKARRNGDLFWYPRMPNCIGWIHRELQDFEGAFNFDQQGVDIARHHHVLEAEANSLINLGIDYAHSGEVGKTTSSFAAVDEIFERDAWFRWRYNIRLQAAIADHWLRQGDVARAREFALRLLKTATEFEVHKYVAVAHKLLAQVALAEQDMKTAEREYVTALDELGAFPVPLVTWRVCAELGRLRKQVGDHSGAKELFDQAGEIVRSIANEVSDEKLRATFLNSEVVREALSGTGASSATSQPI